MNRTSSNGTALGEEDTVQGCLHGVEIISARPMLGPTTVEIEDVSARLAALLESFARAGWQLRSVRITRKG